MSVTSKTYQINEKTIHYVVGDRTDLPLVLFFHGGSKKSQHTEYWTPISDILSLVCLPVFIDRYGYGKSFGNASLQDEISDYVAFASHLMNQYEKKSIYLIGRSAGSGYVLKMTRYLSGALKGVGLVAPGSLYNTIELLNQFDGKICVFWDQRDSVVKFENFNLFDEKNISVDLFSIGSDPSRSFEHIDGSGIKGGHFPELNAPEFFKKLIEHLIT